MPGSVDELAAFYSGNARLRGWVEVARRDAWGGSIGVDATVEGDASTRFGFDIVSWGRDGAVGGEGADADIRLSDARALTAAELGEVEGVQAQLARALRLRFQLEEMDETGENWRNADLSMQEIRERIVEAGGDPEPLFGQLQGTGLPGRVVGLLLRFIEILPGAPPRVKMMMIEMLGEAEGLLESGAGPLGAELISVIIDERDEVVVDALAEVVGGEAAREGWDDVGIIYGAGHMPGIYERVGERFGYEVAETEWLAAISLDMDRYGISPMEHRMIEMQLKRQLAAMRSQMGE
jgi:hypothetical protein